MSSLRLGGSWDAQRKLIPLSSSISGSRTIRGPQMWQEEREKNDQGPLVHLSLCRTQSAADDDTSSELQRLAEMDAPLQGRGGFHR